MNNNAQILLATFYKNLGAVTKFKRNPCWIPASLAPRYRSPVWAYLQLRGKSSRALAA